MAGGIIRKILGRPVLFSGLVSLVGMGAAWFATPPSNNAATPSPVVTQSGPASAGPQPGQDFQPAARAVVMPATAAIVAAPPPPPRIVAQVAVNAPPIQQPAPRAKEIVTVIPPAAQPTPRAVATAAIRAEQAATPVIAPPVIPDYALAAEMPNAAPKKLKNSHAAAAKPTEYSATRKQIIEAIFAASHSAGIAPEIAGGIAWLESVGGNSNAQPPGGSAAGLFQMQRTTANMVMKDRGKEIAEALSATHNPRYDGIVAVLQAGKLPDTALYNRFIMEPFFNSLLGAHGLSMDGRDYNIPVTDFTKAGILYSPHIIGHKITHIDDDTKLLTDEGIPIENINANSEVLHQTQKGVSPTVNEAQAQIALEVRLRMEAFVKACDDEGIARADINPQPVQVARARPGRSSHKKHRNRRLALSGGPGGLAHTAS